ncbi:MAG: C45 family autoproteolytic acyltransferase/hydrolase [Gammaproteobacteria bacterium]
MTTATVPLIEVKGAARDRGTAVGSLYRDRIRATWRFYADTVFASSKLGAAEITARAERVRGLVGDFKVDYCDEIDAVADAAGLARWELHALNARTEILNAKVGECTAVYLPATRTLGQTWDWLEALEAWVALTHYTYPSGLRILTLAEPGQLGKIGLNSAGLGMCLNFLVAPHALEGLPVHVLVRAVLECTTLDEVRALFARAGFGKSSHYLVADADGRALSYEFAGTRTGECAPVDGVYAHTNHCIAAQRDPDGYVVPTSPERLAAARRGAAAADGPDGVAALKQVLEFDDGTPAAIRVRYRPEALLGGGNVGSCATVVMDLPGRTMHVRKGPYADRPFVVHHV